MVPRVTRRDAKAKVKAKVNGFQSTVRSRGNKRQRNDVDGPSKKKKVELASPAIEDGILLTVGTGDIGQLGLGPDIEEKSRACVVPSVSNVVSICAGGLHTLCLTKLGKVFSWGCNDEGALGRPTSVEEDNFKVDKVSLPSPIVQISAGDCHSAALTSDGSIYAWGSFRDNSGPLGFTAKEIIQPLPTQILQGTPIVKIASGNNHLVLLSSTGQVFTCGCGDSGQLGRIAEVFASRNSRNRKGTENLLDPQPLKVYKARKQVIFSDIWAGGYVTFIRAADTGDIYGCGLNNFHQLGDEDTNMKFQPVLLKAFKGKQWKLISSGQHHSVALDEDGNAYSMGRMEYGRLGLGEGCSDAKTPTLIKKLSDKRVMDVSAGESVAFAVTDTGEGYAFGMGTNNQLSQGDEDDRWEPTPLSGKQLTDKKVLAIRSGGQHTVILAVLKDSS